MPWSFPNLEPAPALIFEYFEKFPGFDKLEAITLFGNSCESLTASAAFLTFRFNSFAFCCASTKSFDNLGAIVCAVLANWLNGPCAVSIS